MRRTIILEGPDESGKSTLAQQLSVLTGLPVTEIGPKPRDAAEVLSFCRKFVEDCKIPTIMDRCTPISELVYRAVMGGVRVREIVLLSYLYSANTNSPLTVVLCRPRSLPTVTAKRDYDTADSVAATQVAAAQIACKYDETFELLAHIKLRVIVFCRDDMTVSQLLQEIDQ